MINLKLARWLSIFLRGEQTTFNIHSRHPFNCWTEINLITLFTGQHWKLLFFADAKDFDADAKQWTGVAFLYSSWSWFNWFLAHLKSHQRSSAAFCRPVKFFHTDWIIISLWFLSYTQRHCHVRIEKSSVQTVDIQLDSLEYHYMLKH